MTYVLLRVLGALMPLRGSDRDEAVGMDIVHHGEEAYVTGEGAILLNPEARRRGRRGRSPSRSSCDARRPAHGRVGYGGVAPVDVLQRAASRPRRLILR